MEVSVDTTDANNGGNNGDGGAFAFFGATGVATGDNMGLYELNLDVALNSDVDIRLQSAFGGATAVFGEDYGLAIESVLGSGDFDLPLTGSVNDIRVTIPAGETTVQIKLTAIDDLIIEGGLNDSPGTERASLRIRPTNFAVNGSQASLVERSNNMNNGNVFIEDNDFGKVSIVAVDPDASETGPDSGQYRVNLDIDGTIVTGPITSNEDTIVMVDITGIGEPGLDYQTSINSTQATDIQSPQRIDGFWSNQIDNDIVDFTAGSIDDEPDTAHNTVRAITTEDGEGKHYYEIVLFEAGVITVDIDRTNGFNSHLRIFNGSEDDASDDSLLGNDNVGTGVGAEGSNSGEDSFIQSGTLDAGRYIIEISRHVGNSNNSIRENRTSNLLPGDEYTLNVSIQNHDEGILIPAGASVTNFNIDPIDDNVVEGGPTNSFGSEDVTFTLTGFQRADPDIVVDDDLDSADVTIADNDDSTVTLSVPGDGDGDTFPDGDGHEDPFSTADGVSDNGQFVVQLSQPSSSATQIAFTVVGFNTTQPTSGVENLDDDATYVQDYTLQSDRTFSFTTSGPNAGTGFITIPAGETTGVINVIVVNDDVIEDDEVVRIALSDPPTASDADIDVDTSLQTVVIRDEDQSDVGIDGTDFGVEGGKNGVFTVSLNNSPDELQKVSDTNTDVEFMVVLPANNPLIPSTEANDFTILVNTPATGGDPAIEADVLSYDPTTGKGVVRIGAFNESATIQVVPVDDGRIENPEIVEIMLLNIVSPAGADADIDEIDDDSRTAEILINDNDQALVRITADRDGKNPVQIPLIMVGSWSNWWTPMVTRL